LSPGVSQVAITFIPGLAVTANVASFSDAITGDTASAFAAVIGWGDGETSAGTISGADGSFVVSGTHVYTVTHAVTGNVTVTDSAAGDTLGDLSFSASPQM
jgi:hypothetical protein